MVALNGVVSHLVVSNFPSVDHPITRWGQKWLSSTNNKGEEFFLGSFIITIQVFIPLFLPSIEDM